MRVPAAVTTAPRALRITAGVVVGLIAFLLATLGSCGASSGHSSLVDDAGHRATIDGRAAATSLAIPAVTLRTPFGNPYKLRARTAGKVTLVYFGYTSCPDVCPTTMADISVALSDLPLAVRSRVNVVFITTDPERDLGTVLYAWIVGIDRTFIALRGTPDQVRAAARDLDVNPGVPKRSDAGRYTVSHGTTVTAFGADGHALATYPAPTTIPEWSHDLPILVRAGTVA
ncbi:MAG: SCO family protein [Frankia sp.]